MNTAKLPQPLPFALASLILVGALAACTTSAQTPTVELTVEAILTSPRPTQPVSTPVREATATAQPSATTALAATATLAAVVTPDPSLVTPPPPITSDQFQTLRSPDEQWQAEVSVRLEGHQYHTVFVIARSDGSDARTIVDEYWQGLGASTPELLRWSNDGRYLYFAEVTSPDGGCDLLGMSIVKQVEVATGQVRPVNWPAGSDHVLSPDETTVAYFAANQPLALNLYDLTTRTSRTVTLPVESAALADIQTGGIVWSADGQWLALTSAVGLCQQAPTFSVIKVNTQTLAPAFVVKDAVRLLSVLAWPEPGKLLVRDWDLKSWWINASTGLATTAPQPTASSDLPPDAKPTQEPLTTDEHHAPSGLWSAQGWGQFQGPTYHAELRVVSGDGQTVWTASQDFNAGLGVPLPTPLAWSQDGRYLYYTNVPLVDGYTCSIPVNGSDLWRMDLTDGRVTQLVPEVGLAVSLSPDEQTFAYVSFGQQQNLVLRDLATGDERRMSLPIETRSGGLTWSPDSLRLTLIVAEAPCSGNEATSTMTVDVTTLTPISASS